jgi:hypothetical protein
MFSRFTPLLATASAVAIAIATASSANAAVVYQIDDGESDAAVGFTSRFPDGTCAPPQQDSQGKPLPLGDILWMNSFNVQSGGELIDSVDLVWGRPVFDPCDPNLDPATRRQLPSAGLTDGLSAKILLYEDSNNDGTPDSLVAQTNTTVVPPSLERLDVFSNVVFDRPIPVKGTFFVAALLPGQLQGQYPAALDVDSPVQGGWLAFQDATGVRARSQGGSQVFDAQFDLFNLSNNTLAPQRYTAGNWLLRANGRPVPPKSVPESTPIASLVGMGVVGVGLLARRKKAIKKNRG